MRFSVQRNKSHRLASPADPASFATWQQACQWIAPRQLQIGDSCFEVAQAVAMTIHAVHPSNLGFFRAWRYLGAQPTASVLNFGVAD